MQTLHAFLVSLALTSTALAAVDEPCFGSGGRSGGSVPSQFSSPVSPSFTGVCLKTSDCSAKGGVSITGACPSDPENVRCCTKASCSNGSGGNCRWTSDCAGSTASNQCPGPSQFKCCSSTASGFGGYDAPKLPAVGACKSVAVSGARKVVAAWPGRIRAVVCARDCACRSGFEHCCGTATDFECSDSAGVSESLLV